MSAKASELLRALDAASTKSPWQLSRTSKGAVSVSPPGTGYMDHESDADLIATVRNALPLIADVVEAAERSLQPSDVRWKLRSALTALTEALQRESA